MTPANVLQRLAAQRSRSRLPTFEDIAALSERLVMRAKGRIRLLNATAFERSRYRGGRFACAKDRPACSPEYSCFVEAIGVGSFPWSAHRRITHLSYPIPNGTKVPKHNSIHIAAASAANDSGFLQTALSKTLN